MQRIIKYLLRIKKSLFGARKSRPEDIPKLLDSETLEKVMIEARFLRFQHSVDVRSLEPGEVPDLPKPVENASV
jgi:hypothetical protein